MNQDRIRIRMASEADVTRSVIEARQIAKTLGFRENECQMIATTVSELARNILKYAGKGEITIAVVRRGSRRGMEITARDRGPGIANIEQAMANHFSSSGTLGLGLPGVRRLMDEFEIESAPDQGTQVVVRKWLD